MSEEWFVERDTSGAEQTIRVSSIIAITRPMTIKGKPTNWTVYTLHYYTFTFPPTSVKVAELQKRFAQEG